MAADHYPRSLFVQMDASDALTQCQRELAADRQKLEALSEEVAHARHEATQAKLLARSLYNRLVAAEKVLTGWRGRLARRLYPELPTPAEAADVAELRASSLFDGPWYLTMYPEVAATGLSPELHYLRHGAYELKDPGPEFSSRNYRVRHPQILAEKVNFLLNHLRTGQ
jgi:hypothetical protein